MNQLSIFLFLFSFIGLSAQHIPFQGKLIENSTPITGQRNFNFTMFDGNTQLWQETQNNIQITDGLYSVILGEITPIPVDLYSNKNFVSLEIKVNSQILDTVTVYPPIESDPTVPANIKDGVSWLEVTDKPELNSLTDTTNIPKMLTVGSTDTAIVAVIDQNSESQTLVVSSVWQSFILNNGGRLDSICINFSNANATNVRLRIFNGVGNTTQPIYDQTYSSTLFGASFGLKSFSINTPIDLVFGQNYTFELTGTTNDILIKSSDSNPYVFGISSQGASDDLVFQIKLIQITGYTFSVSNNGMEVNTEEIHLNGRVKDKSGYLVPVGTVNAYVGTNAPEGWLFCDGSEISRQAYGELFSVIGNAFGEGNGSSTFHLPDLRGRFIRGLDGSAGIDPDKNSRIALHGGGNTGNSIGSYQLDEFKSHTHTTNAPKQGLIFEEPRNVGVGPDGNINSIATIDPSGGSETRPKNVYLNYIIKY